jgi:signal transduction histidine kinase
VANPLKVLIVENSEDDAILIADCLDQAGYQADWQRVESARALTTALEPPVPWDLILSDYSMPGFSGLAALKIYQQSGLDIPFILISGSIGEERAVEAMHSGVHDYIMKDRMRRLAPAVDRELREAANRKAKRSAVDENQRLNAELLEVNAMLREKIELLSRTHSDLEQMTWAASHDLKEPVRMVTSYAQLLLRRRPATSEDEVEFCRHITEGAERATALLDGLLAYARNVRTPVDPSLETEAERAAGEAILSLAPVMEILSATAVVEPLPTVRIAHLALLDVFKHLLLNALEYRREGVPPEIHISCTRQDRDICFAVQDNGIGIKPEHQARIFELFRRLHGAEHPGIGVGLPLCRRMIENYGGRLWLESEPGVGSTFYFTLAAAKLRANGASAGFS